MRKWTKIWFLTFVLLFPVAVVWAQAKPNDAEIYARGRTCYEQVKNDKALRKDRGAWQRCIAMFDAVAAKPSSPYAAKAAYSSARLSREMQSATGGKEGTQSALVQYNRVVIDHPQSNLADDALYQIARIRVYQTNEPERARKALKALLKRYPNGDAAASARELLAKLDGKEVATTEDKKSKPKKVSEAAPVQSEAPEEEISYANRPASAKHPGVLIDVQHRQQGNSTEATLFFNRPVSFRASYESGEQRSSKPSVDVLLKETYVRIGLPEEIDVNSPRVKKIKVGPRILGGTKVSFELQRDTDYAVRGHTRSLDLVFKKADLKNEKTARVPSNQTHSKSAAKLNADAPLPTPVASGDGEKEGFWNKLKFWDRDNGPQPLRIVIDPGHGGDEDGAIGPHGMREKDITLEISKKLAVSLERSLNAKVWLTRTKDKTLSLKNRNKIAQRRKADIFISIHANASDDAKHRGIETYYLNNATDEAAIRLAARENESWAGSTSDIDGVLATMLQNAVTEDSRDLAKEVHASLVTDMKKRYKDVKDRGVRSALFYVLVGTKAPGILVETSFVTNSREEMRLADPTYQEQIASSIATGIKTYLSKNQARFSTL